MTFGSFRLNTLAAAMATISNTITASGGTISYYTSGSLAYKVHKFTTTGSNTFTVSSTTGSPIVNILLVGAGGRGASATNNGAGGGGAGQVLYQTDVTVTPQAYSLSVAATTTAGAAASSTGLGYTAIGGNNGTVSTGGTSGDGYAAGASTGGNNSATGGGGAGGSSASTSSGSTAGGVGVSNIITGTGTFYGGGGGSANNNVGGSTAAGGNGGGGSGGRPTGVAGTANTGGGGGGGSGSGTAGTAGNGGSGIVVISYPIIRISTISYISSASTQSTSLTFPTVSAGDIAIVFNTATSNTTTNPTTLLPTGFTSISNTSQTTTLGQKTIVSYKLCTGSESGTTLTTMTGTGSTFSTILIYRASSTPNSLIISTVNAQTTASAPTSQTLTMSGVSGPMIGFAYYSADATVTTRTSSVTPTQEVIYLSRQYIKTYESTSSAVTFSDSTISMTDYGINSLVSFTIQVL